MKDGMRRIKKIIGYNKNLLAQSFNVKKIGVFGSYAKGYSNKGSDIDMLVDFYEVPDMFRFMELEFLLKKLLGRKVDLVTKKALKPLIKKDILRETIYL